MWQKCDRERRDRGGCSTGGALACSGSPPAPDLVFDPFQSQWSPSHAARTECPQTVLAAASRRGVTSSPQDQLQLPHQFCRTLQRARSRIRLGWQTFVLSSPAAPHHFCLLSQTLRLRIELTYQILSRAHVCVQTLRITAFNIGCVLHYFKIQSRRDSNNRQFKHSARAAMMQGLLLRAEPSPTGGG